ncbi:MAG TPA: 50S ribosomal protein L7Ae [Thermoplasmata archaeon]|nr:50S ribosomal protein L7Ae [Thermoplasmata archaeon]
MERPIYVRFETPGELADKALQLEQVASETGKIRVGTNEVTKSSERSEAKLVVMAEDVDPVEILVHVPMLCEEKRIPYVYVPKKQRLGQSAGLSKSAASVAVVEPGDAKSLLEEISQTFATLKK